ncbi:hypothetical protein ALC53_01718 [Atta colombica]|uniref:Uncharacterized protein n=1 Tax=Atta colombica TaxID=520822 RepID=A0A195BT29_9HYME|nr:hypothetical protein ALC53_01718 [Atta colombica]
MLRKLELDRFLRTFLVEELLWSDHGQDHDRIHVIVPLVVSVPLEIAYDRQAPTECHSRRQGQAHSINPTTRSPLPPLPPSPPPPPPPSPPPSPYHRDTVVSRRLPISRPSASSGPHSAAGSPSRSPTPSEPSSYPAAQDPVVSFSFPLILPRFCYEASSFWIRYRSFRALPFPSPSSLFVALSSFPITFSSIFSPFNIVTLILQL